MPLFREGAVHQPPLSAEKAGFAISRASAYNPSHVALDHICLWRLSRRRGGHLWFPKLRPLTSVFWSARLHRQPGERSRLVCHLAGVLAGLRRRAALSAFEATWLMLFQGARPSPASPREHLDTGNPSAYSLRGPGLMSEPRTRQGGPGAARTGAFCGAACPSPTVA